MMDRQVTIFCVFHPPFVRIGITAERKLESVPLENKAYGTVQRMNRRDRPNRNTIFTVYLFIDSLVIELGHLYLKAFGVDIALTRSPVPGIHLFHVVNHVLGALFLYGAAGPPDPERSLTVGNNAAYPQCINIADMIRVEMPDKGLIQIIIRNFHSRNSFS
jgi:hypothetical protein